MNFKIFSALILSLVFFGLSALSAKAVLAARLSLEPKSQTVSQDSEFELVIKIDTQTDAVFGVGAVLEYPKDQLEFKSANKGDFFTDFASAHDSSAGRVELHAYYASIFETHKGIGNVAKIVFKAKAGSVNAAVRFICTGDHNDTQIISGTGENVLSCSTLNKAIVLFSGTKITSTPSPSPTSTPKPAATKSPSPTPQVILLSSFTPYPTPTPEAQEPELVKESKKLQLPTLLWIAIGAGALGLFFLVLALVKKKKGQVPPPQV